MNATLRNLWGVRFKFHAVAVVECYINVIAGLPSSQEKPVSQPLGTWRSRQLTASLPDLPQSFACHLNKIKTCVFRQTEAHKSTECL